MPAEEEPIALFRTPDGAGTQVPRNGQGGHAGRNGQGDARVVGLHGRRVEPAPSPDDGPAYYLCSSEPDGAFESIVVATGSGERRRFFTTRDGVRMTEIDEAAFAWLRDGESTSMLEIDERELAAVETELRFGRPVRGRDPVAESGGAAERADAAEPSPADVPTVPIATVSRSHARADAAPPAPVPPPPPPAAPATAAHTVEESADPDVAEPDASGETDAAEPAVATDTSTTTRTAPAEGEVQPEASAPLVPEAETPAPAEHHHHAAPTTSMSPVEATAQVQLAKGIAFVAHRERLDRSGTPFIDHPGRVAERFDPLLEPIESAAAWLHDVLEDTPISERELFEAGVLPEIIEVVVLLTRTPDVTPDEYYAKIREHPVARRVKLADIDDNTAAWRTRRLDFDMQTRMARKYRHAREALGAE